MEIDNNIKNLSNITKKNSSKSSYIDIFMSELIGDNNKLNIFETIYDDIIKVYNDEYSIYVKSKRNKDDVTLEFEARIGGTNLYRINKTDYVRTKQQVLRIFKEIQNQGIGNIVKREVTVVTEESYPQNVRKITDLDTNEVIWQQKIKTHLINPKYQNNYNFRIGIANEYILDTEEAEKIFLEKQQKRIIMKSRISYSFDHTVKIDFTEIINMSNLNKNYKSTTHNSEIEYQIEVEWISDKKLEIPKFETFLKMILMFFGDTVIIMSETEKTSVVQKVNKQLGIYFKDRIPTSVVNKPKDLHFKDLSTEVSEKGNEEKEGIKHGLLMRNGGYAVSLKADGIRKLLYFGDKGLYFINPPHIDKVSSKVSKTLRNVIFDGELIEIYENYKSNNNGRKQNIFIVFDILHDPDYNFTEFELISRIKAMRTLINRSDVNNVVKLVLKEFHIFKTPEEFYEITNRIFKNIDKLPFKNDGLIFTPVAAPYNMQKNPKSKQNPSIVRKWKDIKDLTIDFEILLDERHDRLILLVGNYDGNTPFQGTDHIPFDGQSITSTDKLKEKDGKIIELSDGQIIEFSWNSVNQRFIPIRLRDDKVVPNFITSAGDVWSLIHNPILLSTLQGNDMILMRKYHNRVKRDLISYLRSQKCKTLLDIGPGKGGDVDKWVINKMKVYAVEPRIDFIKELENRIINNNSINPIIIINAGGEDTNIISKYINKNKVDCVTIFNSLTFFYESENKIQGLINTIVTNLKQNGFLIIIAMDGRLVSLLLEENGTFKSQNTYIKTINNKEIEIYFKGSSTVNEPQHEFLVYFDDLIVRLESKGFKIIVDDYLDTEGFLNPEETLYTNMYRKIIAKYNDDSLQK